jgi:pimeloyl-ACP methyl ester carboxylesterase
LNKVETIPDDRRHLLAPFRGEKPPAPQWFEDAIAFAPERSVIDVRGAPIETLAWGERGKPGLLFLHGNGASADWWSFIAPLFADSHRIAAFSMSGMGGSGWRDKYSYDLYLDEAFAVAEATGLFASTAKPVIIGHSFGAFITSGFVGHAGSRIGGAVLLDGPFLGSAARKRQREMRGPPRPKRIYDTLAQALSRFRFAPDQDCENLFIADWIARSSLRQFRRADDSIGYTWKFDPLRFMGFRHGAPANDLSVAQCPIAVIGGARSAFVTDKRMDELVPYLPKGSPLIVIQDSDHHIMADQPLALVAVIRDQIANWG